MAEEMEVLRKYHAKEARSGGRKKVVDSEDEAYDEKKDKLVKRKKM